MYMCMCMYIVHVHMYVHAPAPCACCLMQSGVYITRTRTRQSYGADCAAHLKRPKCLLLRTSVVTKQRLHLCVATQVMCRKVAAVGHSVDCVYCDVAGTRDEKWIPAIERVPAASRAGRHTVQFRWSVMLGAATAGLDSFFPVPWRRVQATWPFIIT